jgi:hypothetical protein
MTWRTYAHYLTGGFRDLLCISPFQSYCLRSQRACTSDVVHARRASDPGAYPKVV